MLEKLIHRLLLRRHFWRYASFSEIAELYASRTLRIFALRMVSVFTSVYLLRGGYTLLFIALFWAGFYAAKVVFSYWAARTIARVGPKHATMQSNILSALAMVALPFGSNQEYGIFALGIWLLLQAYSGCMNDLAYLVDFSKVKTVEHAGKEIGYMNIIDKIATGLSPLLGGFMAFAFGPQSVMVISALLFFGSSIPLLLTAEPIRIHYKLDFSNFPWKSVWRSLVAEAAIGIDVFCSGILWPIFLATAIFMANGNDVYAKIGLVSSVSLLVGFTVSYWYGRLIDHRQGGILLQAGAASNALLTLARGFIATPASVILVNVVNEFTTAAYAMPFLRGMFDTADRTKKRIEYLFLIEVAINAGSAIAALGTALLFAIFTSSLFAMQAFFVIAALLLFFVAIPRFALYHK